MEVYLPLEIKYHIYSFLNFEDTIKVSNKYPLKLYNPDIHTWEWCLEKDLVHVMYWFIRHNKPITQFDTTPFFKYSNTKSYKIYKKSYIKEDSIIYKAMIDCVHDDNLKLLDKIYKLQKTRAGLSKRCVSLMILRNKMNCDEFIKWIHENLFDCCTEKMFYQAISISRIDIVMYMYKCHPKRFKLYKNYKILNQDHICEWLIKNGIRISNETVNNTRIFTM